MGTGLLAWACLLLGPSAPGDDVVHFNLRDFTIPINIQPDKLGQVREVVLYGSTDMGRSWEAIGRASADKFAKAAAEKPGERPGFTFQAKSDGMHYFSIAIVDQRGVQDPLDVSRAPVGQKILIDTVKPSAKVVSANRLGDEIQTGWEIHEERPDWATFRLEYKVGDGPGPWTPLPVPTPTAQGSQRFRPGQAGAVTVRVALKDLAGNEAIDSKVVPAAPATTHHEHALTRVVGPSDMPPPFGTQTGGMTAVPPPPPPPGFNGGTAPGNATGGLPPLTGGAVGSSPVVGTATGGPSIAGTNGMGGMSGPARGGPLPEVKITNKPDVKIAFNVEKVGPSGLGGVEVFVTSDEGATWEKVKEPVGIELPPAVAGPGNPVPGKVTVRLPREGVIYGFVVVVKSRLGLGLPEPKANDVPHVRVELDTQAPVAELFMPSPDPTRPDYMVLSWKCNDRNLAASPISLEWAEAPSGPWHFIGGEKLPNTPNGGPHRPDATGSHVWHMTQTPPQAYLRLTVRDRAGNVSRAETKSPVPLDTHKPQPRDVRIED